MSISLNISDRSGQIASLLNSLNRKINKGMIVTGQFYASAGKLYYLNNLYILWGDQRYSYVSSANSGTITLSAWEYAYVVDPGGTGGEVTIQKVNKDSATFHTTTDNLCVLGIMGSDNIFYSIWQTYPKDIHEILEDLQSQIDDIDIVYQE